MLAVKVPPAVLPAKLISEASKLVTASLNVTVKLIVELPVGSFWFVA